MDETDKEYTACTGEIERHTKFWLECLKGRDHSADLHTDWRIILKMDLRKIVFATVDYNHLAPGRD
jgi:hypothetical protein